MADTIEIWEEEFRNKFEWRKSRQIDNLRELAEITNSNGVHPISSFTGISVKDRDNPLDAFEVFNNITFTRSHRVLCVW